MGLFLHRNLPKLLQRPVRSGMVGDIEVNDLAGSYFQDHKHIKNSEASRHDDEEIAGQHPSGMISDERHPPLRRNSFPGPTVRRQVSGLEAAYEQPLAINGENSRAKVQNARGDSSAYCLDMHSLDARAEGESEQHLYTLDAWRETPFFTDRERAALAWTEAVTLGSQTHAPDDVYDELKKQFSEKEIVDLTFVIGTINLWNRLAISLRAAPGRYKPAKAAAS